MYLENMPKVSDLIKTAFNEWKKEKKISACLAPIICISRKIGVGSYEIAEITGKMIHCRVYDREILEHLITNRGIDKSVSKFLDERCPGGFENLLATVFREKVFKSEYAKLLFQTIFSIANMGPCIFVGRGAHLLLNRDRVLAVRLTCSNKYRKQRLAKLLHVSETAASLRLAHLDLEQKHFFSNIYSLKSAPKKEFDMVLYMDYFNDPNKVAGIIASAFEQKFGVASSLKGY
jgi:hypothetical protein